MHPVWLFHGCDRGRRTRACASCSRSSARSPTRPFARGGYDWTFHAPLREGVEYTATGEVTAVERKISRSLGPMDVASFRIDLHDAGGELVASAASTWLVIGARGDRSRPACRCREWTLESVDPEPMKVYAAIARDPNPIHWDRAEVAARGLGDRLINQGPLSLGYVINMLLAWAGPASLRGLTVRFTAPVLDGDRVTAGGVVTAVRDEGLAECEVWLTRADGVRAIEGTAVVLPPGASVT